MPEVDPWLVRWGWPDRGGLPKVASMLATSPKTCSRRTLLYSVQSFPSKMLSATLVVGALHSTRGGKDSGPWFSVFVKQL